MNNHRGWSSFAGTFLGVMSLPAFAQDSALPVLDAERAQGVYFDYDYSRTTGVPFNNSPACDDPQYSRSFLDDPKAFFADDQAFENWRAPDQADTDLNNFLAGVEGLSVNSNEDLFRGVKTVADSAFSDGYIVRLTPFGLTFREAVRFEQADKTGTTKTATVSIEWPPKSDSDPADSDF